MFEFKTLLVKMGLDMEAKANPIVATNFGYMVDVEILLSRTCFIPLLNVVHYLIKLSQSHNVFICDFRQSIKVCQADLVRMFVDDAMTFTTP